jgi:hypothetical protein
VVNHQHYLGCFPLYISNLAKSFAGLKCLMLIWLKCKLTHGFDNIIITKKDRAAVKLNKMGYLRGIKELEKTGFISIKREPGKAFRIKVNYQEVIEKKWVEYIQNGGL